MSIKVSENMASVTRGELGTNCWMPKRFFAGGHRCDRVFTCSYPEKKRCQAVLTEIYDLKKIQVRYSMAIANIDNTVEKLIEMVE